VVSTQRYDGAAYRRRIVLDFAMMLAQRDVVSGDHQPNHAKRIAEALQENLARYEATHGHQGSAGQPGFKMRFHPPAEDSD